MTAPAEAESSLTVKRETKASRCRR